MNNQQMAIIKATYTRSSGVAKANIRYIQHRKGREGQRITRELFGVEGVLERVQAYELIDAAESGTNFFRLVISPPQLADIHQDLQEITQKTMLHLAERLGSDVPYIAAAHAADHTPYVHVHCLALVQGRLNPKDFQALRQRATDAALARQQERALVREQQQQEGLQLQR